MKLWWLLTAVLVASPAAAAPAEKPAKFRVRHCVEDAVADPRAPGTVVYPPADDSTDVVTADIRGDNRTVSTMIRLSDLDEFGLARTGVAWHFVWSGPVAGTRVVTLLEVDPVRGTTARYGVARSDGPVVWQAEQVPYVIDRAKATVRVEVPAAGLARAGVPHPAGATLRGFRALSILTATGSVADDASARPGTTYVVGEAACRIPGAKSVSHPAGA